MGVKDDLISLSSYVFDRTWQRLSGLADAEYFWEPVAGCWTIRAGPGQSATADWEPVSGPAPFTTIAWRIWHLTATYGADRNAEWLTGHSDGTGDARCAPQTSAAAALAVLDDAHGWWHGLLSVVPEASWPQRLGAVAGPYREQTRTAFVLHQLDEQIHHGAELGVLRDLYAAR